MDRIMYSLYNHIENYVFCNTIKKFHELRLMTKIHNVYDTLKVSRYSFPCKSIAIARNYNNNA